MLKESIFTLVTLALLTSTSALPDDSFKADGKVEVERGRVVRVETELFVNSGCGADNQKCSCSYSDQELIMDGTGTSGSATGLDFTCNWQITTDNGSCLIKWRIDIPYSGSNGTNFEVTDGCEVDDPPQIGCSGHHFPGLSADVEMTGKNSGGDFSNIDKGSCG